MESVICFHNLKNYERIEELEYFIKDNLESSIILILRKMK